ncbi:MAG: hypothetical protein ABW191_09345, partial [Aliihoeflea sp.]
MVLSERRGSITILTLNNPEQYNALGGSLLSDLEAALETALQEPRGRAIDQNARIAALTCAA